MLGDGTDIMKGVSVFDGGYCAWPELAGRVEQGAAQVLQEAQAVVMGGLAAPLQLRQRTRPPQRCCGPPCIEEALATST